MLENEEIQIGCEHRNVVCLNQHELIRKYRCAECNEVFMCACDEEIGRRFLAHQLSEGVELATQKRVPVTLGFQPAICNGCRGLPLEPAPAAAIPGRTSKIKRFYWRELMFEEMERLGDWEDDNPGASREETDAARERIKNEVLDEVKALHRTAPKYDTREPSQSEILQRYDVQVEAFHPEYAKASKKGSMVILDGSIVSPEAYVSSQYEDQGWSVMVLESAPLHALFGTMMWLLIEHPLDPESRMVGFGSRTAFENDEQGTVLHMNLPEDFGTKGYGRRRAEAIDDHLAFLSPEGIFERDALLYLFDYWRTPSENLRQYLWAHREEDVDRARQLIEILPPETVHMILRYLVSNYWSRYLGWPDLLLHRDNEFVLVEVKSSSDRLSAEQMQWIADNNDVLKLPIRIAKLHRPQRQRGHRAMPS